MPKRRHINAEPAAPLARYARAAGDAVRRPFERPAWLLESRALWPVVDLLRAGLEALKWPFERLAWIAERRLLWPVGQRLAGWGQAGRLAGAGALAAIVVGAGLLAVLSSVSGGEAARPQAAVPRRVVIASAPAPAPVTAPAKPVLQGAPPSFKAPQDTGSGSATDSAGTTESTASTATAAEGTEGAGASASRAKPVPAGPVAMRVARRFAEAFVFYEIGQRPARARTVFGETAAPRLAEQLAERPPRQPGKTKVPQARVLNLVAGPRHGKTYTVSVSLLRVGVTSELRLEMQKQKGAWLVTDVRG